MILIIEPSCPSLGNLGSAGLLRLLGLLGLLRLLRLLRLLKLLGLLGLLRLLMLLRLLRLWRLLELLRLLRLLLVYGARGNSRLGTRTRSCRCCWFIPLRLLGSKIHIKPSLILGIEPSRPSLRHFRRTRLSWCWGSGLRLGLKWGLGLNLGLKWGLGLDLGLRLGLDLRALGYWRLMLLWLRLRLRLRLRLVLEWRLGLRLRLRLRLELSLLRLTSTWAAKLLRIWAMGGRNSRFVPLRLLCKGVHIEPGLVLFIESSCPSLGDFWSTERIVHRGRGRAGGRANRMLRSMKTLALAGGRCRGCWLFPLRLLGECVHEEPSLILVVKSNCPSRRNLRRTRWVV